MIESSFHFPAMGGPCELTLVAPDRDAARAAARAAIEEVTRIESKYSRYRQDSVVSRINATAGSGQRTHVDEETASLLHFGEQLFTMSRGRFDLTSGALRQAWDFRSATLPSADRIQALLARVGWPQVSWQAPWIELTRAGMELDFGGIGKEYASDRAAMILSTKGIVGGYVNLGGDLRVIGPRADGRPWRMAIQHPRLPGDFLGRVEIQSGALSTSGDYERFMEVDGRRYCHLLDARTGWPVDRWQSVSVIAPTCAAAGAISTLAMLMGEAALEFLTAQGVPSFAVRQDGNVFDKLGDSGAPRS